MTQLQAPPHRLTCTACGAAQPRDALVSLEIDVLQREVTQLRALLDRFKPHFVTASYYLDQHAHLLHRQGSRDGEDPVLARAREEQSRALSGDLMDAYCRTVEALATR